MKKQRGQVIVEFALILPLFLLMIFGLIYSGMLFYDYSTLSNVARSAAREAAIESTITDGGAAITANYYSTQDHEFNQGLITHLYKPKVTNGTDEAFKIELPSNSNDIIVTITMQLNVSFPLVDLVLPEEYQIKYHMRKDVKS